MLSLWIITGLSRPEPKRSRPSIRWLQQISIGLTASVSRDPSKANVLHVAVRIDANDVALAREAGQYTGQLRVALVAYPAEGGTPNPRIVPLDVHYTATERDRVLKEGIPYQLNIELDGKIKALRFIVYDRGSRQAGSLTIPIETK